MNSVELNKKIVTYFPEIEKEYKEYIDWNDGEETGSFLIVEDVLMEYIYEELEKNNKDVITRLVNMIEEIYSLNDEYASNVIVVGILENLKCSKFSKKINEFLLPKTKNEFINLEI